MSSAPSSPPWPPSPFSITSLFDRLSPRDGHQQPRPWHHTPSTLSISPYSLHVPFSHSTASTAYSPSSLSFPSPHGFATVPSPPPLLLNVSRVRPAASIPTPSAMTHVRVRGDGRCLFRAIAKGLAFLNGKELGEGHERADADYLRKVAWNVICKQRRSEFERRNIVEGSLTSYCAASRHPTFYGGEPELFALADELRIPIAVYLRANDGRLQNIVTYGEEYYQKLQKLNPKVKNPAIRLLYVNGNHYDALIPKWK